jgi:ATP-dependent Clp protease ATP-binding subunit ClpA
MDEAASRWAAVFNLPPDLREMQSRLDEMEEQMEAASANQDYAEAMHIKSERLALKKSSSRSEPTGSPRTT